MSREADVAAANLLAKRMIERTQACFTGDLPIMLDLANKLHERCPSHDVRAAVEHLKNEIARASVPKRKTAA